MLLLVPEVILTLLILFGPLGPILLAVEESNDSESMLIMSAVVVGMFEPPIHHCQNTGYVEKLVKNQFLNFFDFSLQDRIL